MPIYEYKCLACEAHFEKIQKADDEQLKVCEKCGGELAKQWSLSGFQFKGEGWYVTDYAGKKNGSSSSKDGESTDSPKPASEDKKTTSESSEKPPADKKQD